MVPLNTTYNTLNTCTCVNQVQQTMLIHHNNNSFSENMAYYEFSGVDKYSLVHKIENADIRNLCNPATCMLIQHYYSFPVGCRFRQVPQYLYIILVLENCGGLK